MDKPQPEQISLADFLTWEQHQPERHEWIAGTIVRCRGGSDDHAAIISNLIAALRAAVGTGPCFVRGSDRQLVPRDEDNNDLGAFYADVFVSCAPEDRIGGAAHFPTVVIEVLSDHSGQEFTRKQRAYLGSAKLRDYIVIESTSRYTHRYSWKMENGVRRLVYCQQRRGPVDVPSLKVSLTFDEIYAGTSVPAILHPISSADEEESEIMQD